MKDYRHRPKYNKLLVSTVFLLNCMVCNFDALRDFSFALKRLAPASLAKSGTCGLRKVLPNSDFFLPQRSKLHISKVSSILMLSPRTRINTQIFSLIDRKPFWFYVFFAPAAKDVTAEILAATNLLLSSSQRNVIITCSFSLILSSL